MLNISLCYAEWHATTAVGKIKIELKSQIFAVDTCVDTTHFIGNWVETFGYREPST